MTNAIPVTVRGQTIAIKRPRGRPRKPKLDPNTTQG
jgi:hypothetical protein